MKDSNTKEDVMPESAEDDAVGRKHRMRMPERTILTFIPFLFILADMYLDPFSALDELASIYSGAGVALAWWAYALPCLFLAHARFLPRAVRLALPAVLVVTAYMIAYQRMSAEVFARVRSEVPAEIQPDPWILVPIPFLALPPLALLVLPCFAGLFLAGRNFRMWRFALGYFSFALLVECALSLRAPATPGPILGAALLTLAASLPFGMKRQRLVMGDLLGRSFLPGRIDDADGHGTPVRELGLPDRLIILAILFALTALVPAGAVITMALRESNRIIMDGPVHPPLSPSLVNGYDSLKEHFSGEDSVEIDMTDAPGFTSVPNSHIGFVLPSVYSRELAELAYGKVSDELIDEHLMWFEDFIEDLESVREADYIRFPGATDMHWMNVRTVARALALRSVVRNLRGDPLGAIHDIDTLLRFGVLMQSEGTLIRRLLGTAVIMIAVHSSQSYLIWNRHDPEALEALIGILKSKRGEVHTGLLLDQIARYEMSISHVVLLPEISAPAMIRGYKQMQWRAQELDLVLTAALIEMYRHDTGDLPGSLDDLVPDYLPSVPRDVKTGKPVRYDRREGGYGLKTDLREEIAAQEHYPVLFDYQFPDEFKDPPDAWRKAEEWTPGVDVP